MLATVPPTQRQVAGNVETPTTAPGTTVTASASTHTKGSWAQLGTDLTEEAVAMFINVRANASPSGADSRALLDIGIDLAGGTSFTEIVSNLNIAGLFNTTGGQNKDLLLPIRIPAGAAVGARHQAAIASDSIAVSAWFLALESYPWMGWSAVLCDTLGADTAASEGTRVSTANQGASGAEGTWVPVGADTTKDYRAILCTLGPDGADTAINARGYVLDIGMDPTGGTTYTPIVSNLNFQTTTSETFWGPMPPLPHMEEIPQGSSLAVRISSSGSAVDNLSAILHCFA